MEKTLGGDRLGSGKKMKVELHNYERSTHDLGFVWRSSMASGTLVPFLSIPALPGDTFDINLNCDVKTHPTIGPLFGSYKIQLDVFQAPIRLYQAMLHNNMLGIGRNMSQVILPKIELKSINTPIANIPDLDNSQVNPSSLLAYLGIRGVGINLQGSPGTTATRRFNAVPILAYWEIYKNYYANKQEEIGAVLHTPSEAIVTTVTAIKQRTAGTTTTIPTGSTTPTPLVLGTVLRIEFTGAQPIPKQIIITTEQVGDQTIDDLSIGVWTLVSAGVLESPFRQTFWGNITADSWRYKTAIDPGNQPPKISTFALKNIDDMRTLILQQAPGTEFVINSLVQLPYDALSDQPNGIPNVLSSQEGLGLKTYQSDLFNNWLKTENIDAITTTTAIDTTAGSFTIDTLNLSRKVYNMLNRINVSGGSYDDWIDAVYTHEKYDRCETPMYMGGLIKELVFQQVISQSQSEQQPLGTLAGRGSMADKHKGGKIVIKVDEPSYIIGIVSLTPRIDYSQGNTWDVNLNTVDDLHKPALDEIGFQELITEQQAWWDTHWDGEKWIQKSAGKQPAWLNYMTDVNKTRGNFAISTNEMFMTLNRRYEKNSTPTITDLTTYIDPSKFNFIFAQTSLDSQNFWTQIGVDITARRKMSSKIMPNL